MTLLTEPIRFVLRSVVEEVSYIAGTDAIAAELRAFCAVNTRALPFPGTCSSLCVTLLTVPRITIESVIADAF
jgi:hypothetical protein